jgi:cysteine dioxygenase
MRMPADPAHVDLAHARVAKALDFEGALEACRRGALRQHLQRHPPPLAACAELAVAPAANEPYARRVLHHSARGEVLLMRFAADTFCAPHDHADALAYVSVLQGELHEQRFAFDHRALVAGFSQRACAGEVFEVPRNTIHCMKGTADALALHFYSPAISGMRIYDALGRRTLVLHDDCGAWMPADPAHVLSVAAWP